ncbi:MAG: tol-pal system protein YbgF [Gammaproteobacteria bacterium]|nr:tol-pal system protein YbgF [Gammaproteobacteria bacterium]
MKKLILLLTILSFHLPLAMAQPSKQELADMEQRLTRMERLMNSQVLVDMQLRLEQMQQELQSLRGEVEQLNYQLQESRQHQRDLYQDIDRRLLLLERGGVGNGDASQQAADASSEESEVLPSLDEQKDYQQGINLLKEFRYAQAAKAFDAYLNKYPQGRYAPIARYWLADSYYSDRKYKPAIEQYQLLLKEYSDSPKAPQALLKVGYSQAELKQWAEARKTMEQVIASYPKTTEADLATRYLQRLKQQGH